MKLQHGCALLILTAAVFGPGAAHAQTTCASLTSLALPNTVIQSATTVAPGPFVPPPGPLGAPPQPTVPIAVGFCRVRATTSPVPGSSIAFEVWLPTTAWNRKLMGIGNSGANGEISYTLTSASLASSVNRGYAAVGTDTGHTSSPTNGLWAIGFPERIVDNGTRSIGEVTAKAKAILAAFYGTGPGQSLTRSYFFGCSMGGRQGLMQAQRFPASYDGIVSGAPVIDLPNLAAAGAFQAQQLAGPAFFPAAKLPAIAAAVRAECDADDGLVDGLLTDPRECDWDPHTLLCSGPETNACLTEPQAHALEQLYKGPRRSDTNAKIYPGLERGGEDGFGPLGWSTSVTGPPSPAAPPGTPGVAVLLSGAYINNVALQNPNPLFKTFTFDFAADLDFVAAQLANLYNANDPNLTAFKNRGGTVLMYHGWSDPVVPPGGSVEYHKDVRQALGTQQALSTLRLFMAPGMEHCVGGTGPFLFDAVTALERWVEQGIAPERIVATQVNLATGAFIRSRPLCRYPMVARYTGSGNVNDAASFVCEESD